MFGCTIANMWKKTLKKIKTKILIAVYLILLSSFSLYFWYNTKTSFIIVFGSFVVLFLPGFFMSYIFFPLSKDFKIHLTEKNEGESKILDWAERLILSIFLSMGIVAVSLLSLRLLNIVLTANLVYITVLVVTIILAFLAYAKQREVKHK